jgi:hypothetical protein
MPRQQTESADTELSNARCGRILSVVWTMHGVEMSNKAAPSLLNMARKLAFRLDCSCGYLKSRKAVIVHYFLSNVEINVTNS